MKEEIAVCSEMHVWSSPSGLGATDQPKSNWAHQQRLKEELTHGFFLRMS